MWLYTTFETHNITLSIFPEKIPETRNFFFKFYVWPSPPNIAPKSTDQSRSNPLSRVLLEIFLGVFFFVFDQSSQLWVVLFKKLKFRFSKNGFKDFHDILWVCRTFHPTIWHYEILPENFLKVKKKNSLFCLRCNIDHRSNFGSLKSNWNHKLLIVEVTSKLIERLSSYKKQANDEWQSSGILRRPTISIVSAAMLLNQQTAENVL